MRCIYFPLIFHLEVRRPDGLYLAVLIKLVNKHTGVTADISFNCYTSSLSNTATQAGKKNEILTQCWFIVGAALQMMAQY